MKKTFKLCFQLQPSSLQRGAAAVRPGSSRFFNGDGNAYWIADEPGYFKFTLPCTAPVVASGVEVLPLGDVFFNAKIEVDKDKRKAAASWAESGAGSGGEAAKGGGGAGAAGSESTVSTVSAASPKSAVSAPSVVRLVSGVATVKRDVPSSFMGANYSGMALH